MSSHNLQVQLEQAPARKSDGGTMFVWVAGMPADCTSGYGKGCLVEAMSAGKLSPQEAKQIMQDIGSEPLVRMTKSMPPKQVLKIWQAASPAERTPAFKKSAMDKLTRAVKPEPAERGRTLPTS